jgi:hypothetical protein
MPPKTTQSPSVSEDEQGTVASTVWSSIAHVEPAVEASEASSTSSHATRTTEPPPPALLTTHTTQSHSLHALPIPALSLASSSLSSPSAGEEVSASLSALPAACMYPTRDAAGSTRALSLTPSIEGSTILKVAPLQPLTFHVRASYLLAPLPRSERASASDPRSVRWIPSRHCPVSRRPTEGRRI